MLEHASKWTTGHSTDRIVNDGALRPRTYPSANLTCVDRGWRPKFDKPTLRSECTPTQTSKFAWTRIGASQSDLSPSQPNRRRSTARNTNARAIRPTPAQAINVAWTGFCNPPNPSRLEEATLRNFYLLSDTSISANSTLSDGVGLDFGWLRFGSL